MTDRVQQVLEQTIDLTIHRGSEIIAERHDILRRMIDDDIKASEREALALRFFELGMQWHLLTSMGQTRH